MLIYHVMKDEVQTIINRVSRYRYQGNLVAKTLDGKGGPRVTKTSFTLRTISGRKPGARQSFRGRHMPVACWHAHYHVLLEIYKWFPEARLRTAFLKCNNLAEFLNHAPLTRHMNIGSRFRPMEVQDACNCGGVSWQGCWPNIPEYGIIPDVSWFKSPTELVMACDWLKEHGREDEGQELRNAYADLMPVCC